MESRSIILFYYTIKKREKKKIKKRVIFLYNFVNLNREYKLLFVYYRNNFILFNYFSGDVLPT